MRYERNYDWDRVVEIRIQGVHTDQPAPDAKYYKTCYDKFVVIPAYSNLSPDFDVITDDGLQLWHHLYV